MVGAAFQPAKAEPTALPSATPARSSPSPQTPRDRTAALDDPDALRAIAQLTARWAAAFVLDPDGITRTKPLGTERMSRKLRDALPAGHHALRAAVWEFVRPMLSPALPAMHRDAFLTDEAIDTTVRLADHRADSDLDDLDLHDPTT
jgi:hypothetical protein